MGRGGGGSRGAGSGGGGGGLAGTTLTESPDWPGRYVLKNARDTDSDYLASLEDKGIDLYPERTRSNVKNVPIRAMVPTQDTVDKSWTNKIKDPNDSTFNQKGSVRVVKRGSEYIILDGHHRYAAAQLRGRKTIKAVVVDAAAELRKRRK